MPTLVTSLAYSFSFLLSLSLARECKVTPDSPAWPSVDDWNQLNSSIGGRLLQPAPPGAVCHPDQPTFNNASCPGVTKAWMDSSFHSENPITLDYNDLSCYPDARYPCEPKGYPSYVVDAHQPNDVQMGVSFAQRHKIRLTIKGTGHDFPGRSAGGLSMSIWTHNLQKYELHQDYTATACNCEDSTSDMAVTLGAGLRVEDVLKKANDSNAVVALGSASTVGVGFLLGGGHGPLTSKYGLAADQVLEVEVVTADGKLLVANACQNEQLFFALRGGGGSTYGVMVSATLKAYPMPAIASYDLSINTTVTSDTFWDASTYLLSQLPRLSDAGLMGYYYLVGNSSYTAPSPEPIGTIYAYFIAPGKSAKEVEEAFAPIKAHFNENDTADPIVYDGVASDIPSFYDWWYGQAPEMVGFSGRLGSRLLSKDHLTQAPTAINKALRDASPDGQQMLGHLVAGPGVINAKPAGGQSGVNPAWRKAYTHIVLVETWIPPDNGDTAKQRLTERVGALRRLAPDSGAYVNEGDPNEPNWKQTFWGDNYDKLLQIKQQYDPEEVFWCFPCVGGDLWSVDDAVMGWIGELSIRVNAR
ncbi:MAG: hypothetical protein M4579_007006 [Chaenotheca gracillima]|nr:MAG: hypothetical protein M4579_007006 [Chaenotheca gracillima]